MKAWRMVAAVALGAMFTTQAWAQQTTLRIFTGGQQRPDVMRKIADEYQKKNPNVKVDVEVGGATSEAQQQYLSTVLSSKDSVLDVILIDVIRPAQWAAQGWAEPFDSYLGADKPKVLAQYLKAYADANGAQGGRPNFVAVAAYDGMTAIAEVVKRLGATIDGDKAMEILKGMRINSPRGPIVIDRETRDVVQTVYIRKVEKTGGGLYNVEFDRFPDQKDPGKP